METVETTESPLDRSLKSGYEFKMGEYISTGFEIFKAEPWLFMGFLILSIAASWITSFILGQVSLSILSACVEVPLGVGYFIAADKINKKQVLQFGDFFGGFKLFGPLMLFYLARIVLFLLIYSPAIFYVVYVLGTNVDFFSGDQAAIVRQIMEILQLSPVIIGLFLASTLVAVYFSVALILAAPLITLNRFDFWTAIKTSIKLVNKNWFSFLGFVIVLGLIIVLGAICLIIGIVAAIPVVMCAIYAAYNDIAGDSAMLIDTELSSTILDA